MESSQQITTLGWAAFILLDVCYLTYFVCGKLVVWFHARVAYARKVMHFVTFALPWALQQSFHLENDVRNAVHHD